MGPVEWLMLKAAAMLPTFSQGTTPIISLWRTPDMPPTDPSSLIRDGYETNSAVFACVQALARAFPEPTLRWYDGSTDKPLAKTHPLVRLTTRPNGLMGADELWAFAVTYAGIGGNGYLYKLRAERSGRPGELWPYHGAQMAPVPGTNTWVDHYDYRLPDDKVKRIDPADVVHWKWAVHPRLPWLGLAPLSVVMREVLTDTEMTRFLQALLLNDAVPRGMLILPPNAPRIPDENFKRLKKEWELHHGGANRGGIGILEGGLQYQRIALDMGELDLTGQRQVPERRIAAAFGIPVQVAGLGDDPTYSNYEQAELAFTQRVLVPLWKSLASELTADLAPDFGDVYCAFDLNEVAALRRAQVAAQQQTLANYLGGLITRNEGRKELNKGTVEGGDEFVSKPAAPNPNDPEEESDGEDDTRKKPPAKDKPTKVKPKKETEQE